MMTLEFICLIRILMFIFLSKNKGSNYIGCYQDCFSGRDITNLLIDFSNSLTIELCISTCFNHNYLFAGLQRGYLKNCPLFEANIYKKYVLKLFIFVYYLSTNNESLDNLLV